MYSFIHILSVVYCSCHSFGMGLVLVKKVTNVIVNETKFGLSNTEQGFRLQTVKKPRHTQT